MNLIGISISSIFMLIFLTFSLYWAIVFIRRIRLYKVYQKSACRNILDFNFGYINEQYCYHYDTEIRKYVYLLAINSAEALGSILYYIEHILYMYFDTSPMLNLHHFQEIEKCGNVNSTYLIKTETINSSINFVRIIDSVGNIADIAVVSLSICLMNYLTMRIKGIETSPGTFNNTSILTMTSIVSFLIVLFSTIRASLIVGRIIYILAFGVYFWNFVKTVKQFRFTLQFRSIQRLAQHGSNKEEMRERKYFKYTTNILCVGFFFIFVSICFSNLMKISISTLFFSDCFPISNLSPDIHFQISNEEQLHILTEIVHYSFMFAEVLVMFGIFIVLVPFILVFAQLVQTYVSGNEEQIR